MLNKIKNYCENLGFEVNYSQPNKLYIYIDSEIDCALIIYFSSYEEIEKYEMCLNIGLDYDCYNNYKDYFEWVYYSDKKLKKYLKLLIKINKEIYKEKIKELIEDIHYLKNDVKTKINNTNNNIKMEKKNDNSP